MAKPAFQRGVMAVACARAHIVTRAVPRWLAQTRSVKVTQPGKRGRRIFSASGVLSRAEECPLWAFPIAFEGPARARATARRGEARFRAAGRAGRTGFSKPRALSTQGRRQPGGCENRASGRLAERISVRVGRAGPPSARSARMRSKGGRSHRVLRGRLGQVMQARASRSKGAPARRFSAKRPVGSRRSGDPPRDRSVVQSVSWPTAEITGDRLSATGGLQPRH